MKAKLLGLFGGGDVPARVGCFVGAGMLDVSPNPPSDGEDAEDADDEVEAMKPCLESIVLVPLLAEQLSDVSQADAPRQRARESVDHKAREVHARNARRKGYEGANRREQAADEDDDFAVTREPAIREV